MKVTVKRTVPKNWSVDYMAQFIEDGKRLADEEDSGLPNIALKSRLRSFGSGNPPCGVQQPARQNIQVA